MPFCKLMRKMDELETRCDMVIDNCCCNSNIDPLPTDTCRFLIGAEPLVRDSVNQETLIEDEKRQGAAHQREDSCEERSQQQYGSNSLPRPTVLEINSENVPCSRKLSFVGNLPGGRRFNYNRRNNRRKNVSTYQQTKECFDALNRNSQKKSSPRMDSSESISSDGDSTSSSSGYSSMSSGGFPSSVLPDNPFRCGKGAVRRWSHAHLTIQFPYIWSPSARSLQWNPKKPIGNTLRRVLSVPINYNASSKNGRDGGNSENSDSTNSGNNSVEIYRSDDIEEKLRSKSLSHLRNSSLPVITLSHHIGVSKVVYCISAILLIIES